MSTPRTKTLALLDHLQSAVESVEPGVNAYGAYREASQTGRASRYQEQVLGDPVYYLEVLPAAVRVLDQAQSGEYRRQSHDMQATLLYEYTDDDSESGRSQPKFDERADAIISAAAEGYLVTGVGPQELEPQEGSFGFAALDSRGETVAHELVLPITMTDAN